MSDTVAVLLVLLGIVAIGANQGTAQKALSIFKQSPPSRRKRQRN